jgi:DNA repair protein RecO (recombination protein O)
VVSLLFWTDDPATMIFKTKGIVLGYIKYKETSIIAKVYTDQFGIQSYIINSIRSTKSRTSIALFQPLTLLDMEVYHKDHQSLHRIKEYKVIAPFLSIPYDHYKTCIALFLTEVLSKVLKEEEANPDLFSFIASFIRHLDHHPLYMSAHLHFLIHLSSFLGFQISSSKELHDEIGIIGQDIHEEIDLLIHSHINNFPPISNQKRRDILHVILKFYTRHFETLTDLRSLKVITEIMKV